MLACPAAACPEIKATRGDLLHHLVYDHGVTVSTAERLADLAREVEAPAVAAARPVRVCTHCGEPHADVTHRRCDRCRACPCKRSPHGHVVAACPTRAGAGIKTYVEPEQPLAIPSPTPAEEWAQRAIEDAAARGGLRASIAHVIRCALAEERAVFVAEFAAARAIGL